MKILFINPSLRPDAKRRQLPVGLAYVMTATQKAGFQFDLIDMDIDQISMSDLASMLANKTYDIYALGCIVTGFRYIREIADIIKKTNPESLIVAGNSVATSIPEILLNHTQVDVAVLGEGDVTFVELVKAQNLDGKVDGVAGIALKDNGAIVYTAPRPIIKDLDPIGFPEWDIFDLQKYENYAHINANVFSKQQVISYPLNSARGCPFACTFCYHVFKGEKYRKYSERAVSREIQRLHDEFDCDFISFWDELTFPNKKSVERMICELEKLDFAITWQAPVRGDLFTDGDILLIKDLKAVGCDNLSFSLENASPVILRAMKKKLNVPQFIRQTKALWKAGVPPLTSIVFGYPQETPQTIRETIEVCEECQIYPSVGFLLPLPGTAIYEWAKREGYVQDEVAYLERIGDRQDFHINLTSMSDKEFVETVETELGNLAAKMGLKLESVFKTVTYQIPKKPS